MVDTVRLSKIVDNLVGTCNSCPQWVLDDYESCVFLDNLIFSCYACGWWCDIGECVEFDSELMCDTCYAEQS